MNENNIALVRATNIIPFDGIVRPLSSSPILTKDISFGISSLINDILDEEQIIPPVDFARMYSEDGYDEKITHLRTQLLKKYLPYLSDYNSIVLFALNGLCPDDNEHGFANNTFSDKKCAIIDPLSEHLSDVISLVPTDTSLKGNISLSKDATILIDEPYYLSLNDEQKKKLSDLEIKIVHFNGSIKEAIISTLKESNRYIPETLSLSASTGGIMPSETSTMQLEVLKKIREQYGFSKTKYYDLLTGRDPSAYKYEEFCQEYNFAYAIKDYYTKRFLNSFLSSINIDENTKSYLVNNYRYKNIEAKIKEIIKNYGIGNFKVFVENYNEQLMQETISQNITPQSIIDMVYDQKELNI